MSDDDQNIWTYVTRRITPIDRSDVLSQQDSEISNVKKDPKTKLKKGTKNANTDFESVFMNETMLSHAYQGEHEMPRALKRLKDDESSRQLDARTAQKLKRGQMEMAARLDLHGLGRIPAHHALEVFITDSFAQGHRMVLVITGKGRQGKGVLRDMVPRWLYEGALSGIVLQHRQAKPHHGGDGAFYVYLRRDRA